MHHVEHCAALETAIDAFANIVAANAASGLTQSVPACPEWDLAALTRHVGRVHRWSAETVRELAQERMNLKIDIPDDPSVLADWIREGGAALLEVLRATDPDVEVWAWGADQHVKFWSRRQLHETEIHLVDAASSVGINYTLQPTIAADGIDELLDNLPCATYFSPAVAELAGNGETIHLHATDGNADAAIPGEWMIERTTDGFQYSHAHGKGDVAVRGSMNDLALLMWHRAPFDDRFEVFGDRALMQHWLDHSSL